MGNNLVSKIMALRLLIGFLGEKSQFGWWASSFIGRSSEAFLLPIYPRTTSLAQYHGVCEAALLVHEDNRIGIGNIFHLYRLPNSIERTVAEHIRDHGDSTSIKNSLLDQDNALAALGELSSVSVDKSEGPVSVGAFEDAGLSHLLDICAAHYLKAFQEGYQCFPYMGQGE